MSNSIATSIAAALARHDYFTARSLTELAIEAGTAYLHEADMRYGVAMVVVGDTVAGQASTLLVGLNYTTDTGRRSGVLVLR